MCTLEGERRFHFDDNHTRYTLFVQSACADIRLFTDFFSTSVKKFAVDRLRAASVSARRRKSTDT